MIGTIAGDYVYEVYSGDYRLDEFPAGVMFNWGSSRIEGQRGTIYFDEFTAIDNDEQQGPNGAVLLYVSGGTGQWENATGHIALSGFWHMGPPWDGKWDYQGEVCIP
jgi:hypothetical protein